MLATPYQMKVCALLKKIPKALTEVLVKSVGVDRESFVLLATPEAGEDPRVTRAKFFIRDEFLVSVSLYVWTV